MRNILLVVLIFSCFQLQLGAQSLSDSVSLESFMDGVVETILKEKNIAGATLAIIKDNRVILKKGYGFSDYENQVSVDPDKTMFRIGSITKLLVWTSVMRLVSEGKLDLDADINTYLKDFKIPATYDQPITLTHLMTHTPGFEDHLLHLFSRDSTSLRPLGEILADEVPARVRPPFTQASYSNHGTAMAAYIVEQVTGVAFIDYVEMHFLKPLKMSHATLRQPIPLTLSEYMSKGYVYEGGYSSKPFEYVPLYPAGAASASALDMSRWMQAYLNHGRYGDYTLIDSASLAKMIRVVKRQHPMVNGMPYGFMDLSYNGRSVIGHGGDTFWFHSLMALMPEEDLGFFISFNTDTGGGVYATVYKAFMDRYFPDTRTWPEPMPVTQEWLTRFSGQYTVNRYPHTDILKLASLFSRVNMSVTDDNRLKVDMGGETSYYVVLDSTTFRKENTSEVIAFEIDDNGKVVHAYEGLMAVFTLDKVEYFDSTDWHNLLFGLSALTALLVVLQWPLVALIRRNYLRGRKSKESLPLLQKLALWLNYVFLLLFIALMMVSLSDPMELVYGIPSSMKIALVFPLLMIVTTLGMLVLGGAIVQKKNYSWVTRLAYILLTLISLAFLWQLNYWNFIGFNY
jgi:CubicO group peptidase (beta-lactamase class C family)